MAELQKIKRTFYRLLGTRKGIVLTLLAAVTIAAALALSSAPGRARLFRFAEKLGLRTEAEHKLVPVHDEQGKIKYWTCTMHPSVRGAGPGTCPI